MAGAAEWWSEGVLEWCRRSFAPRGVGIGIGIAVAVAHPAGTAGSKAMEAAVPAARESEQ